MKTLQERQSPGGGKMSSGTFGRLCREMRNALLARARKRLDADEAEDAVQETLLKLWEARDRFEARDEEAGFLSLARVVLHGVVTDMLEKRAKRAELLTDPHEALALAETCSDIGEGQTASLDTENRLLQQLDRARLTRGQRICVEMWLAGHAQAAIARQFAVSRQAVGNCLYRAARKLQRTMELGEEPTPEAFRLFAFCSKVSIYRRPSRTRTGASQSGGREKEMSEG